MSADSLSPDHKVVRVRPWVDPLVERCGFPPASPYVEFCYLPVLGPSATWLYRRLGALVNEQPDGGTVDLTELFLSLGLGGVGRSSPAMRSLARLAHFGVVQSVGPDILVRRAVAPLTERQLGRLPESVRSAHAELLRRRAACPGRVSG
jgi:hypothetical protein